MRSISRAFVRGALAALLGATVAACDQPQSAPVAVRPAAPAPIAETPYKHDNGGADPDLVRAAYTYSSPHYEKTGRLPPSGDTRCLVRRAERFEVDGQRYGIVATWASTAQDCSGPQAIVLSLTEMQSDDIAEDNGRTIVEIIGPETMFWSGMKTAGWLGRKPPKAFVDQRQMKQIDELLKRLTSLRPFTAERLSPWAEDQLQPALPAKLPDELTFQPFADRQTYEAARRQKAVTLCWKPEGTNLRCFVEAPRRRPAQVLLFAVHGFNAFAETDERRAIAMMTGVVR